MLLRVFINYHQIHFHGIVLAANGLQLCRENFSMIKSDTVKVKVFRIRLLNDNYSILLQLKQRFISNLPRFS